MTKLANRKQLSSVLLQKAPGNRHGITLEPQQAKLSMSDVRNIIHIGVPGSISSPWRSASGGVGFNEESARLSAIGESIERYCATISQIPLKNTQHIPSEHKIEAQEWCLFTKEQRAAIDFPFASIYSADCLYTNAYNLQDNKEVWVPQPFITLRDDYETGIATSSGLAAAPTARKALLRAIQELIERDALMITWLHNVPARRIKIPGYLLAPIVQLKGEVWAFDLTPSYSPFPVIAVAGGIKKRGKMRYSLGVACREDWESALQKAYLEWNQGILFTGIYGDYVDVSNITDPKKIKSFDEHAIYFTLHPDEWLKLPMFKAIDTLHMISVAGSPMSTDQALRKVKKELLKNNIRLYYRDLTTIDATQLGIRVVRASSPDLAQIFAHQEWPLIGKLSGALQSRYPWANNTDSFPNKMPHPLG